MKKRSVSAAHRGEAAEHTVAAALLEDGFTVSWPSSHAAYDLIVEPPSGGLIRVQVKRAYFGVHSFNRPEVWMVNVRDGNNRTYDDSAFDVLAIVVGSNDGMLGDILFVPWDGQYRGQKIVTDEMFLEYGHFPCLNSS